MNLVVISLITLLTNSLVAATNYYYRPTRMMGQMMDWMQGNDVQLMKYMQPNEIGRDRSYDNLDHIDGCLCTRDCCKYPEPRICYYKFFVEQYTAMGPACRNCSTGNTSDCYQHQCIIGDGVERMVFSINRKIPGPQIDVCFGDRIIVDTMNLLTSASLTIHWHGMKQERSPWMDGVPYLTQCPIPPNGQFRYDFIAETPGTLFYHSHIGNLQRDGVHGALIVRTCEDPNACLYEYDNPSHVVDVTDWFHVPSDNFFPGYYRVPALSPAIPNSCIINGLGSYTDNTTRTSTPHAQFFVRSGYTYRWRVIAAVEANCPILFTIEDHSLTVIAVDGSPIVPVTVKSLYMASGIRIGFVLTAKKKTDCRYSYNIVVQSQEQCLGITQPQTAYLIYEDCEGGQNAQPLPANLTSFFQPPYLDRVDFGCNNNQSNPPNICSSQLQSVSNVPLRLTCGEPDYRFFLDAGAYQYSYDDMFNNKMMPYQFFYLPAGGAPPPNGQGRPGNFTGLFVDTLMHNISSMMPPCPLLTQEKECHIPQNMICHGVCSKPLCSCVNILEVKLNSYVEMVIRDNLNQNHPMHLHGHDFVVLEQGSPQQRQQPEFWRNSYCKKRRPVVRDVVMTPGLGYVIIRFFANNPGFWLFHCHFQNHMDGGMYLIFKVGKSLEFLPIPKGFPKCGPYLPEPEYVSLYMGSKKCSYASNQLYRYNYTAPNNPYKPKRGYSMPIPDDMRKHI